jgi:hypothetical protein
MLRPEEFNGFWLGTVNFIFFVGLAFKPELAAPALFGSFAASFAFWWDNVER